MIRKIFFLFSFFYFLIFILKSNFIYSSEQNTQYLVLDNFEKEGDWKIRFSKHRSKFWDSRYYDKHVPSKNQVHSDDQSWIKWIKSDPNNEFFKKINLIPPTIANKYEDDNSLLSIRGEWDKGEANWLMVYPSSQRYSDLYYKTNKDVIENIYLNDPHLYNENFIILPSEIESLSVFVWSMGHPYKIEAHFYDYKEAYHSVKGHTDLNYFGWKQIQFKIPNTIPQKGKSYPYSQPLKFLGFKIYTSPKDPYQGFFAYFDQIRIQKVIKDINYSKLIIDSVYWPRDNKNNEPAKPTTSNKDEAKG